MVAPCRRMRGWPRRARGRRVDCWRGWVPSGGMSAGDPSLGVRCWDDPGPGSGAGGPLGLPEAADVAESKAGGLVGRVPRADGLEGCWCDVGPGLAVALEADGVGQDDGGVEDGLADVVGAEDGGGREEGRRRVGGLSQLGLEACDPGLLRGGGRVAWLTRGVADPAEQEALGLSDGGGEWKGFAKYVLTQGS